MLRDQADWSRSCSLSKKFRLPRRYQPSWHWGQKQFDGDTENCRVARGIRIPRGAPGFSLEEGFIMKNVLVALTALVMVVTSFAVTDAEAGLFRNRKSKCCKPACCEPVCCEPAPCCEAAPACPCEAAPACGCEAAPAPCGCEAAAAPCGCEVQQCSCQMTRREARKARRAGCCAPVTTCGCEAAAPACGCEAAPACGCEAAAPCGCGGESSAPMIEGAAPEAAPEAPSSDSTT